MGRVPFRAFTREQFRAPREKKKRKKKTTGKRKKRGEGPKKHSLSTKSSVGERGRRKRGKVLGEEKERRSVST